VGALRRRGARVSFGRRAGQGDLLSYAPPTTTTTTTVAPPPLTSPRNRVVPRRRRAFRVRRSLRRRRTRARRAHGVFVVPSPPSSPVRRAVPVVVVVRFACPRGPDTAGHRRRTGTAAAAAETPGNWSLEVRTRRENACSETGCAEADRGHVGEGFFGNSVHVRRRPSRPL